MLGSQLLEIGGVADPLKRRLSPEMSPCHHTELVTRSHHMGMHVEFWECWGPAGHRLP